MPLPPRPPPPAAGPPRPPKKSAADVDAEAQVEMAMAFLEGRNVEMAADVLHHRRDAEERQRQLAQALEGVEDRVRKNRIRSIVKITISVTVLGALAYAAIRIIPWLAERQEKRDTVAKAADEASTVFRPRGFAAESIALDADERAFPITADNCYVVVGAALSGTPTLSIKGNVLPTEGAGTVGFCACVDGTVEVAASGEEPIATRVLKAPVSAIGGTGQLALAPTAAAIAEQPDKTCEERQVDAWLGSGAVTRAPESTVELEQELVDRGFQAVSVSAEGAHLVRIPDATNTCFFASSRSPGDKLTLRLPGGSHPVEGTTQPIVGCAAKLEAVSVWREGEGAVTILTAPADKVGGMLGFKQLTDALGLSPVPWLPSEDRALDARNALLASGLPGDTIVMDLNGKDREKVSLFALSTDQRTSLAAYAEDPDLLCIPPLPERTPSSLCVHATAGGWSLVKHFPVGAVGAPRPFWLTTPPKPSPEALARDQDVLALARRLSLLGFSPTTSANVKLTATGAEVSGRSGEKEVVAVVLSNAEPWVHLLYEKEPWVLDETPELVSLPAGQSKGLTADPPFRGAAQREPVVWRR